MDWVIYGLGIVTTSRRFVDSSKGQSHLECPAGDDVPGVGDAGVVEEAGDGVDTATLVRAVLSCHGNTASPATRDTNRVSRLDWSPRTAMELTSSQPSHLTTSSSPATCRSSTRMLITSL